MKTLFTDKNVSRRTVLKGGCMAVLAASTPMHALAGRAPEIKTISGPVKGERLGSVNRYLGIPYAQSISGKNRFLPPQPVEPWKKALKATRYADSSPQQKEEFTSPVSPAFMPPDYVDRSDDCLALNVWAPADVKEKLPVMVWLHGGGWTSGSGSCQVYDGENLARRGDVIIVTINHRLGLSGFTDFSRVLGGDYADSANLGLQDIHAALTWVKNNIAAFGGNPDLVTIFGESGGGWKVSSMLSSPPAEGLFHRAVIQSGPLTRAMSHKQADSIAQAVLTALDIDETSLEKLNLLSTADIVAAEAEVMKTFPMQTPGFPGGFWPVLDETWMPQHPFEPVASASSRNIPLMIGQTGTEFSLFMLQDEAAYHQDDEQLTSRIEATFGKEVAASMIETYKKAFPEYDPSGLWFRMYSDYVMGALSLAIADARSAEGNAPVYAYRFDWKTPMMDGKLHSPHTIEIPFVFDNANGTGGMITGGGERVEKLAETVSSAWVHFAKTGKPAAKGLPEWPEYSSQERSAMHIDHSSRVGAYMPLNVVPIYKEKVWKNMPDV